MKSVYILNYGNAAITRVPGQFSDREASELNELKELISNNLSKGMFLVFIAPYDSWWDKEVE